MRLGAALLVALLMVAPAALAVPPPRGGQVDLVIVELRAQPPRPLAGEPFRLVATVENVGADPLTRTSMLSFWSNDTLVSETKLAAGPTSPLLPSARVSLASASIVHASPGYPSAYALVDSRGSIAEADEANNEAWSKVPISVLLRAIANPTPGAPYQGAERLTLTTTWDEPFARLDCAFAGSVTLEGPVRNGAFARVCSGGEQQGADTFTLLPGDYALGFATMGDAGAAIYGVPHPEIDPGPREG